MASASPPSSSLPTGDVVIELDGVRKAYPGGTVAVDGLDLRVHEHEIMVLIGPSGCGKSTTLRMINRLVEPTGGRILVEGRDVASVDPVALRRRIGYVIQNVGLFPHRTIAQNVATVPALLGWERRRAAARTDELLDLVGLDPARYRSRYPHQLSGGEQQRVGVARALAADPPVLLMDEPFGAVDPVRRRSLQQEFWRIQRRLGTTVVLVTHDLDEAVRLGDRIAVLSTGGHLEQVADAVSLLARPATPMVADFVGAGAASRLLGITQVQAGDVDASGVGASADIEPSGNGTADAPTVALGTRLDEVLATLVAGGSTHVQVADAGGRVVGRLDGAGVLAAVRRAAAEPSPEA